MSEDTRSPAVRAVDRLIQMLMHSPPNWGVPVSRRHLVWGTRLAQLGEVRAAVLYAERGASDD